MHKLYKITNNINQKCYIGITKLSIHERLSLHVTASHTPKYPIQYAIRKYGPENFSIELLCEDTSRKIISDLEEPTILQFNARANGYNVAKGGIGGDLGEEAAAKRSATMLARSPEEKARLANLQRERQLGKTKLTDAGRLAQSQKMLGNQFAKGLIHSAETCQKISNSNKGKIRSAETKQRIKNAAITNSNGKRFAGRRASCICCQKTWDIGNYIQHIKRMIK